MIVLSIDPGVERTGFALFDRKSTQRITYLTSGLIQTDKSLPLMKRIAEIYDAVSRLVKKYRPQTLVMERVFFAKNQKTAITVGQAQGVLMLLAAKNDIDLHVLTPTEIKLAVTGYGNSDKRSVQKMLQLSLNIPLKDLKQDDQADAIACGYAFCCMNELLR